MQMSLGDVRPLLLAFMAMTAAVFPLPAQDGDDQSGWPREIVTSEARIVIYQPQAESLEGNDYTGRAAVMVRLTGGEEPVFGAVWYRSTVETDRDARTAHFSDTRISRVRFPNATEEQERGFIRVVEAEIPKWNAVISLDNLLTSLEVAAQEEAMADDLKMDPPKIVVVNHPAVLIMIDGKPQMNAIEDTKLMRVVNTPYLMVFDGPKKAFWLNAGYDWLTATAIEGPWNTTEPSAEIAALAPPDAVAESGLERNQADRKMPQVVVATEPTELISFDGEPTYTPLPGNEILYAANTESDVLMHIETQQYYVLLSGRWFHTRSLANGPWEFVRADALPTSFQTIPEGSEKGYLRASVAGTQEARDAVMDAQIPQTAAISRADAKLEVQYDGEPIFDPVDGTSMQYATNTSTSVLKIGDLYYSCDQGVWFQSRSAEGPWELADSVPEEVQKIPPSNPNYNVKYVYVYDATPQTVYVGYTPAYTGCYHYHGTVVYGTGWYYRPWIGPYYYYPRHASFGFGVRYNPWTGGWGFGMSFGYGGFSFSFGWGSGWHGSPWYGPRAGWWGPAGYRAGYRHGFRAGYWAGRASARPPVRPVPYNRANNRIHARENRLQAGPMDRSMRDNIYQRPANSDRVANRDRVGTADRVRPTDRKANAQNNVFADRDGNVFRRNESGWEKQDRSGWQQSRPPGDRPSARPQPGTKPSQPSAGQRPSAGTRPSPGARPSTGTRPSRPSVSNPSNRTRPSTSGSSRLDRDHSARQRGSSRTQNYNRSRPSTGSRGMRPAGGGRRR